MESISTSAAPFRVGKIKSKYLVFEVLCYSHYLKDGSKFLFQLSNKMRRILIENYFTILNTLIPDSSSLKDLDLCQSNFIRLAQIE